MQAFHNDDSIKKKYVTRMQNHIEADELVRKETWDGKRGCAVGCTLEMNKYIEENAFVMLKELEGEFARPNKNNMDFIANAPSDIAYLLEEVRRLRAALAFFYADSKTYKSYGNSILEDQAE